MAKDKPFGAAAFEWREGKWHLRLKKSAYVCSALYCRRKPEREHRLCSVCRSRQYRSNNSIKYAFHNLKRHAKQRGIRFQLTYPEFEAFCKRTGYHDKRGKSPEAMTVDRIKADQGYHINNIEMITMSENTSKNHHTDHPKQSNMPF